MAKTPDPIIMFSTRTISREDRRVLHLLDTDGPRRQPLCGREVPIQGGSRRSTWASLAWDEDFWAGDDHCPRCERELARSRQTTTRTEG